MIESLLTISITGLLAGFIFAMPIAGPISIMIVSNALNGRNRFSSQVSIGAALADFIYIFIAVYGLTRLYTLYKPAIPYLFLTGAVFFIILGYKIFNTRMSLEHLGEQSHIADIIKSRQKGGVYTGFMINLLNPTLFLGGLTSSFFVISLVASLGFNTGGLDLTLDKNVKEISSIEGSDLKQKESISMEALKKLQQMNGSVTRKRVTYPPSFHLFISICYAIFLSLGSLLWCQLLVWLLTKYRRKINLGILTAMIRFFGIILWIIGIYFGYSGVRYFI